MSNVLNEDDAVLLKAISDWTGAFGISHVQRLMRWGYQRSINAVEALTQHGELVITSQGQWSRALKLSEDLPSTNPVIDRNLTMPSFPFDVSLPLPKGSDWSSLMSNMHSQLMAAYGGFKRTLPTNDPFMYRLTPPLLMSVPKKWEESKKRVLVVGQETLGWDSITPTITASIATGLIAQSPTAPKLQHNSSHRYTSAIAGDAISKRVVVFTCLPSG